MRRRRFTFCLFAVIIALQSFAQPQLVGTLQYLGPQEGGSIFRYNLPATTPGAIYSFNNLAPHRPIGGLALGDADWVYGVLSYNGVNGSGLLYKIKKDDSLKSSFVLLEAHLYFKG